MASGFLKFSLKEMAPVVVPTQMFLPVGCNKRAR